MTPTPPDQGGIAQAGEYSRLVSVKLTMKHLLILALSCLLCACATPYPTADDLRRQLQAQMQEGVVEDGISAAEAEVIAQSYFFRFGLGCGVANRITDGGEFWISPTYTGIAAMPTREPIRIDKHTGRVTWSDGPIVENPKAIWDNFQPGQWPITR